MSSILNMTLWILLVGYCSLSGQQLQIDRIEQMPNIPQPYKMRDWHKVTLGYDSLVFNYNSSGQYLPLIWDNNSTINYPEHSSFGLHTVVGTNSPISAEAINCLPAIIGASLNGIDKSNQTGKNFVLMCEEWFNNRPEQNVYKNHPVDDTYDDWWYETMPNIFFYQLYDLYPEVGHFDEQFTTVADQWLNAVEVLGGDATPWNIPDMDYRGFDLSKMEPYKGDVQEPEAAGAIGWILYNAYVETKQEKYRIGAEWCIEYLNSLTSNPSYELQLPYGVFVAARMNAELGTDYDIKKMLEWTFNVGPLRNWGAVIGNWGGYDVSGLIGEVNGNNDYPFSMNTFEQIGALVPLVRYDDRFARAIGKWVLNAANASRLFYTKYLPDNKQDSEEWGHVYDPNSYLAHEAVRELKYGQSPYATGDAVDGGWGETNYTLYSSSHVGILGAIIDTTNVPMILKLDLLKADYFNNPAYPTYLLYNPYDIDRTVELNVGEGIYDIYETTSNSTMTSGVTGIIHVIIPPDNAVVITIVPSGGTYSYELAKTLINDIVVDYNNGINISNYPPRIKSLSPSKTLVLPGEELRVFCTAIDKDDDNINYTWIFDETVLGSGNSTLDLTAPVNTGTYYLQCIIDDGKEGKDTAVTSIKVVELINNPPEINNINASPRKLDLNNTCEILCLAIDPDSDELSYTWSAEYGNIEGSDSLVYWTAPGIEGNYVIKCKVTDINNSFAIDSIVISVCDFDNQQSGNLILYLPFNGSAIDESGNSFNCTVNGAALTGDRFGTASSAYRFDGVNDNITIENSSLLNFNNAITVCFWMKVAEFYEREAYPVSHGNWENRWKISITNNRIRWTVNTIAGIKDLDSETELVKDKLYFVTCVYSGTDYEIYLNSDLDAFTTFSGSINATSYDLIVGQVLPGNTQYNFNGVIDDLRIYDYALPYSEITELYDISTSVEESDIRNGLPTEFALLQNYPNPCNPSTQIEYIIPVKNGMSGLSTNTLCNVSLKVFNILGQEVVTLVQESQQAGRYQVHFDVGNIPSGVYFYKLQYAGNTITRKMSIIK